MSTKINETQLLPQSPILVLEQTEQESSQSVVVLVQILPQSPILSLITIQKTYSMEGMV
jgi:hypothetical protein